MKNQHLFVTGGAGFIASHLIDRLLAEGCRVTAMDNFDPFYPRAMKEANIAAHRANPDFRFVEGDICDLDFLLKNLPDRYDAIVHLAADFGMKTIAEGVETAAGVEQLCALGCDFAQGYHFSKPVPAEEAAKLYSNATCRSLSLRIRVH